MANETVEKVCRVAAAMEQRVEFAHMQAPQAHRRARRRGESGRKLVSNCLSGSMKRDAITDCESALIDLAELKME